jgi:hypothetical protein
VQREVQAQVGLAGRGRADDGDDRWRAHATTQSAAK